MKSKLLLALTCSVIGMAAFTGEPAYADTPASYCASPDADWYFNDPNCPAYISAPSGKAAFGEPTEQPMTAGTGSNYCVDMDWDFNNPNCPAYLPRAEGKAAYGDPSSDKMELGGERVNYCVDMDWSFNDPNCPAYIRR